MTIKKNPTTSVRKPANELKVYKKTVKTAFKQDLCQPLSPSLRCIGRSGKRNKCNFQLNIGLLETAIEKEWNKTTEKIILKACKSFQRRVDTIIEKMMAILSKFTHCVYLLILSLLVLIKINLVL